MPPAPVIASSADFEKAWAFTVTAEPSWPRTLMSAPLDTRPRANRLSRVTSERPDSAIVSRLIAWYRLAKRVGEAAQLRHPLDQGI